MADTDKRSKRGRELAARLNRETILEQMPKLYFVLDGSRVRIGRTDWPGDYFNIVPSKDFEVFKLIYEGLNMPLLDKTDDD